MAPEAIHNRILSSLPAPTLDRLRPSLRLVETRGGEVLEEAGKPVRHLYFVNRGLVSLVSMMRDGRVVEARVVGNEGMTTPHVLFWSNRSILQSIVQVPGSAFRIEYQKLKDLVDDDSILRDRLERYLHFAVISLAHAGACNRLHRMDERCCRWLLIAHDSAGFDTFPITHEFLAMMLGVRRSGISVIAKQLQDRGVITYSRGQMTILDRDALEEGACECYETLRTEYASLL